MVFKLAQERETTLVTAITAAREAGEILKKEFNRLSGPHGGGGKAQADSEAEFKIYERLSEAFPEDGFLAEENEDLDRPPGINGRCWVVDPNDGTRSYLRGFRGSAISIALLERGKPVLGVVYAFNYPDDNGDLVAWSEGGPIFRNGKPIARTWPRKPSADCTVLISQSADKNPVANARCVSPMRYRAIPSIAYRLALAAIGEGEVAVSLNCPTSWDLAGGHALLLGAGADLYTSEGKPVRYSEAGNCNFSEWVFGGPKALVDHIRSQDWHKVYGGLHELKPFSLSWPQPGGKAVNSDMLSRAQGCLLGQISGDALGSLVEFENAEQIHQEYPDGVCRLIDGGTWDTIAGQPTDDTEMALMLARTLIQEGVYRPDSLLKAYKYWLDSGPFDIGGTISSALSGRLNYESQANGALMRVSPLGIFGVRHDLDQTADWAQQDAALTHPHPVCRQTNALFTMAIAHAVKTGDCPRELYHNILKWGQNMQVDESVLQAIENAKNAPPEDYTRHQGWVLIAFQNALYQLLHAEGLEAGVVDTAMRGGDTDTNAAICGALLGAVHGRDAIPEQWYQKILTCRPLAGLPEIRRPRPECFWPVDAMNLAERLIKAEQ